MTATIKPPDKGPAERRRLRLSSMEILGFSDSSSTWSDSPAPAATEPTRRGRHETTVADLQPQEFGGRLTGGNVRWGLVTLMAILFVALTGLGLWLYQRPAAQAQADLAAVEAMASELAAQLPTLEQANDEMLSEPGTTASLTAVESAARALFEASGELGSSQDEMRSAASQASSSTLDGVRLVNGARSYRAAVLPMLAAPGLETDPEVIELDEAARRFGDWQLTFNGVRTALPEGVLPEVTEQLDILSGDLASLLGRYVDALRQDDMTGAESVLAELGERLDSIRDRLETSVADVQSRVEARIGEAGEALASIPDA